MPRVVITNNTVVQTESVFDFQYTGLEDTHIRQSDPDIAQGSNFNSGVLEVTKYAIGDENRTLVRASGLSNLPANGNIQSAELRLYQTVENIDGYNVSLRRVLQPWIDNSATWNQYDGGLISPSGDWDLPGCSSDGLDREFLDSSTTYVDRDLLTYHAIECTDIVQDIVDGTISTDHGWLLFRTSGGNDNSFKLFVSSEGTDGRRPELFVEYTVGSSDSIVINSAASEHTSDELSVSFNNAIEINGASHLQTSQGLTLVYNATLTVNNSAHNQLSNQVLIDYTGPDFALITDDATHIAVSYNIEIAANSPININYSRNDAVSEEIVVSLNSSISIEDSVHAAISNEVNILTSSELLIDSSAHFHVSDSIALNGSSLLLIGGSTHSQTAESCNVYRPGILLVDSIYHAIVSQEIQFIRQSRLASIPFETRRFLV